MHPIRRRTLLKVGLALPFAAPLLSGCRRPSGRIPVGFAQIDTGGVWRAAETASMIAAAGDRFELVVTDAQDQTVKQIGDVEDLLARRVKAVFVAPRERDGLEPALQVARDARVPVFFIDREADGIPGVDFVSFLGSDFVEQGRRAGEWLAAACGGTAGVVELTGTPGASVAQDRADGFRAGIAGHPGVAVLASQTAHFARSAGQAVLANLLQSLGGRVTAVYAHNDEMALGGIQAARAAGREPGRDIRFVSIDGQRSALEAVVRGELACTVESSPRFGPLAFATLEKYLAGEAVPARVVMPDRLFDRANAAEHVAEAY